jgi:hypothetical protein
MLTTKVLFNLLTHIGLRRRFYRAKSKYQELARLFKEGSFWKFDFDSKCIFAQEEIENEN